MQRQPGKYFANFLLAPHGYSVPYCASRVLVKLFRFMLSPYIMKGYVNTFIALGSRSSTNFEKPGLKERVPNPSDAHTIRDL